MREDYEGYLHFEEVFENFNYLILFFRKYSYRELKYQSNSNSSSRYWPQTCVQDLKLGREFLLTRYGLDLSFLQKGFIDGWITKSAELSQTAALK